MAQVSLPDYYKGALINPKVFEKWDAEKFLTGYLIVNCDFVFPDNVKYPSIPCYTDKTSTVYPLKANAVITGPEYWMALRQGCNFNIKSAFYIEPKNKYTLSRRNPLS
jgi:hypothetical protein